MNPPFDNAKTDFNDVGDHELVRAQIDKPQSVATVPSVDRPDMSIIERQLAPAPKLDLKAFGPWQPWISDAASAKSAPSDYVAMSLLTATAAMIGAARWVSPWSGWTEPAVIWTILVGTPSAGKSPAIDTIRPAISEIERELEAEFVELRRQHEADCVKAETHDQLWKQNLKKALTDGMLGPDKPPEAEKPEPPSLQRVSISDSTVEASAAVLAGNPRGVLLLRDELSGFLGNLNKYGDGDRAYWIEAFGARQYTVDRKKLPAPLVLPHLAVSILGGIQPDRLTSLLAGHQDDDGFAARFLYVWPEPVPPMRPKTPVNDQAWVRACRRLRKIEFITDSEGQQKPIILPVEDAALEEFQAWRVEHHEASKSVSSFVASAWGKMPGYALRLALVLEHLLWAGGNDDTPPRVVSRQALGAALDLVEAYFKPMLQRTFGSASQSQAERDAATLARALLARNPRPLTINAREIRREWSLPGLNAAPQTDAAIAVLVEAGWLWPPDQTSGRPGRKPKTFCVNQTIYEDGQ